MRLIGRGYLQRGAAILLLSFVVLDVSSSDVCGEKLELLGFPNSCITASANSSAHRTSIPAQVRHTQQNGPSQSMPEDDDCLCWCPHVLPTLSFDFNTARMRPPTTDLAETPLPIAPPHRLYHPPRPA